MHLDCRSSYEAYERVGPLTAVRSALFADLDLMGSFAFVCDGRGTDLGLDYVLLC